MAINSKVISMRLVLFLQNKQKKIIIFLKANRTKLIQLWKEKRERIEIKRKIVIFFMRLDLQKKTHKQHKNPLTLK